MIRWEVTDKAGCTESVDGATGCRMITLDNSGEEEKRLSGEEGATEDEVVHLVRHFESGRCFDLFSGLVSSRFSTDFRGHCLDSQRSSTRTRARRRRRWMITAA